MSVLFRLLRVFTCCYIQNLLFFICCLVKIFVTSETIVVNFNLSAIVVVSRCSCLIVAAAFAIDYRFLTFISVNWIFPIFLILTCTSSSLAIVSRGLSCIQISISRWYFLLLLFFGFRLTHFRRSNRYSKRPSTKNLLNIFILHFPNRFRKKTNRLTISSLIFFQTRTTLT